MRASHPSAAEMPCRTVPPHKGREVGLKQPLDRQISNNKPPPSAGAVLCLQGFGAVASRQ